MNPRRLLVALLSALLLSGALTYFLTRRINGRNGRPAAQATQKYVAASRPLPAGELLKPENLTLVEWPVNMPLQGAFSKIRSEEHTSELQSLRHLVCRLLLEKKKNTRTH